MSIQKISTEQLRRMGDREGLVLQGCGGDPQEWLDGINQILTDEGILKKGTRFEEAYTFQHDGVTCLLFPFKEGMAIEMGRLAMWRLQTHSTFGGTWLSDYVPNRLGGFLQEQEQRIVKPDCPLIGRDGNIYNLLGIAGQTLREHGMEQQATEMFNRISRTGTVRSIRGLGRVSPTSTGRFPDAGNLPVRQVCINAGIACQVYRLECDSSFE